MIPLPFAISSPNYTPPGQRDDRSSNNQILLRSLLWGVGAEKLSKFGALI
ncbi:hypothetical protein SLEP1_g7576 [Rubroshorea leprosula]|uniref:Uncharacterized protein n=1 Tax=Rubroshorea leprosula TaxID=152421 RepID=A0AAV5HZ14_9ROSI|nr:hypothetical protein SLEP1_g7576 [Rubroshorea leprosula]